MELRVLPAEQNQYRSRAPQLNNTMSALLEACREMPVRELTVGEVLIAEGDPACPLFILEHGSFEIVKRDIRINVVSTPGAMFGEVSLLLEKPSMATVRALEASRVRAVDNGIEFLNQNPAANLELARLLAKRLNGVTSYLVDLRQQFSGNDDHLGMVDEVLESLLHAPK
ncbi:MAG: CRP/FNR family cyclic AMP-dependent transcriptional regulator [Limisphaerales bacterium]